jgi:hypothetical protein
MKVNPRIALLLFSALMLPLRANLGDTVAQCVKRYGKPVGFSEASPTNPFGTLVFTAAGYQLVVFLVGESEVGARISKTDKKDFTEEELKNIMFAEADPQSPWTPKTSDDPTCLEWARGDKAKVLYDKTRHILILTSPSMTEAVKKMPPSPATNAPAAAQPVKAAATGTSGLVVP